MKKLSLFLLMGLLFTIFSCDNSIKQESELSQDVPSLSEKISEETKLIDIVTPDGETFKIPIPVDFDENDIEITHVDSESAASRNTSCCITTDGTPCTSVLTFYAIPRNSGAANFSWLDLNVGPLAPTFPDCGELPPSSHRCKTYSFGMNQYQSTTWKEGNNLITQNLESGDVVQLQGIATNTSCVDFLLIIGQWNCSGGQILLYDVCESGSSSVVFNQVTIGKVTTCFQKCGFNPTPWTPTCSSCS